MSKCYPRLPKNSAADVSPNSSELSYLVYYSSTRSAKLPKVGAYLERKTAGDIANQQSARILVTLQILSALLDNKVIGTGNAFALISPSVLRILRMILKDTIDVSIVEATTATFDILCKRQGHATLVSPSRSPSATHACNSR